MSEATNCLTVRYSSLQQLILAVYLPDDAESPTVVLDRIDGTPSPLQKLQHLGVIVPPITVAEGVVTPDPFRDVIRTEPAPDLPSLIEDMIPYLLERHTSASTTPISTTISRSFTTPTQERKTSAPITFTHISTPTDRNVPITPDLFGENINSNRGQLEEQTPHDEDGDDDLNTEEDKDEDSGISLDSVLQFLFYNDDTTRTPSRATHKTTSHHFGSDSSTSQETMATSHNTPATPLSQNLSKEDNKNKAENTTAPLNTTSNNEDALNFTTYSTAVSTKFSTVPHAVFTTVSNVSPTASSREPPPGKPPILQHPQLRAPVSADPGAASGLLKLAGCNIYGRMYRVGRIISELSGPCLECMCTEVGVQCRPLDC
jgi:hypothetical protein